MVAALTPGKPNATAHFSDLARGWHMAASWVLFSVNVIPNWQSALAYGEGQAKSEKTRWLGMFEMATDEQKKVEVINELSSRIDECKSITAFQAAKIAEMRGGGLYNQKSKDAAK